LNAWGPAGEAVLVDADVKALVRLRDGYRCRACGMSAREHFGSHGETLQVHRVVPDAPDPVEGCVALGQLHAGRILLNPDLIVAPVTCVEYAVAHEPMPCEGKQSRGPVRPAPPGADAVLGASPREAESVRDVVTRGPDRRSWVRCLVKGHDGREVRPAGVGRMEEGSRMGLRLISLWMHVHYSSRGRCAATCAPVGVLRG